jgi:hypothetical protein
MATMKTNRREQWQKVLDGEVQRWLAMPLSQMEAALRDRQVYEVEFEANTYQVEIEILQNNERYIQVMLAVDDGSLPASLVPTTRIFIRDKPPSRGRRHFVGRIYFTTMVMTRVPAGTLLLVAL